MGGADVKRIDQTINLLKHEFVDIQTGEVKQNQYFEPVELIFGIASIAAQAITRTKSWVMISSNTALTLLAGTQGGVSRPAFSSWSPVNNCTPQAYLSPQGI